MSTYKTVNKKYGELTAKLSEEIPWNKLFVDIIDPYKIPRKGREPLILKRVTTINPITGGFEITKYNNKKSMATANLVENTWLFRYP